MAHSLALTHPVHVAMLFLADRVKEKSGGKLPVDIYPNLQLGSERESVEFCELVAWA